MAKSNDIAFQNDLKILEIVNKQKIIREDEIAVLADIKKPLVVRSTVRLEKTGELIRDKTGFGVFVRPKSKRVTDPVLPFVPPSWRHDALAFYVLNFLAYKHRLEPITEKQIRDRKINNKIADGKLIDELGSTTHIVEVEWSYKSWVNLEKMVANAVAHATNGIFTIFAFPKLCDFQDVDHSARLNKAIQKYFGKYKPAKDLKNYFFYLMIDFQNAESMQKVRNFVIQEWDIEENHILDMPDVLFD
jgi:hypothetical protein